MLFYSFLSACLNWKTELIITILHTKMECGVIISPALSLIDNCNNIAVWGQRTMSCSVWNNETKHGSKDTIWSPSDQIGLIQCSSSNPQKPKYTAEALQEAKHHQDGWWSMLTYHSLHFQVCLVSYQNHRKIISILHSEDLCMKFLDLMVTVIIQHNRQQNLWSNQIYQIKSGQDHNV